MNSEQYRRITTTAHLLGSKPIGPTIAVFLAVAVELLAQSPELTKQHAEIMEKYTNELSTAFKRH